MDTRSSQMARELNILDLPIGVYVVAPDGRFIACNRSVRAMLNLPLEGDVHASIAQFYADPKVRDLVPGMEMCAPALRTTAHQITTICQAMAPGVLSRELVRDVLRAAAQLENSACLVDVLMTRTAQSHYGDLRVVSRPSNPGWIRPDDANYYNQPFVTTVTLCLPEAVRR